MERREETLAEKLKPSTRLRDFALGIIAGSVMALAGVALRPAQAVTATSIACPKGLICLDPVKTSCLIFDMSIAGWQPVQENNRMWVSGLVAQGKAQYRFQDKGIDCYHRHPDNTLGEKVGTLPSEWWHRNKFR